MDGLLLVMVLVWGGNYSLVKATLDVLPPRAFNALRMGVASAAFAALLGWAWTRQRSRLPSARSAPVPPAAEDAVSRHDPAIGQAGTPWDNAAGGRAITLFDSVAGISRPSAADWLRIVVAGLIGHTIYQLFFIEGLARTTAANAALLIGCSPIVVSIASAIAGHDRLARNHWFGLALSFSGVYLVVGRAAAIGGTDVRGDLLMLGAVLCWAMYAVLSRTLLHRHSPLFVTGWTMIAGTAAFAATVWRDVARVAWGALPAWAWHATILSALTALTLAYLIYYVSVTRIGVARTTVWTNMVPLVGMVIAWAALGESVDAWKVGGASLILAGVGVTRLAARAGQAVSEGPAE